MRRAGASGVLVLAILTSAGTSSPARAQPAPITITAVDTAGYPRVSATISLPPGLGGPLPPEAFQVIENETTVASSVAVLPAADLEVVLVLDTSGSMAGPAMLAAKASAVTFLNAMPPATRIAVVGFGETPVLASGFSLDRAALATAVNDLQARGETALYDAIVMAVAHFPPGGATHRSLVLLSDGGDTTSQASLEAATGALAAAGVHVDAVELASTEANRAALAALTSGAGGRVVPATDPAALDAVYGDIASSLANQYRLTYRSTATGAAQLRVTVVSDRGTAEGVASFDAPRAPSPPARFPEAPVLSPPAGPAPDGSRLLLLGAACFFGAFGLVAAMVLLPRRRRSTARAWLGSRTGPRAGAAPAAISGLAESASQAVEGALERRGKQNALNEALEQAGVSLRPGEFLVLCASGAATALLLGLFASGPLVGVLGALLVAGGARFSLRFMAKRRRAKFTAQLSDTLQLMSGSLRAGYGLLQAFDAMANEAPAPTSDEFRRVVVEARLGRSLPESLHAMRDRLASQDFGWVVEAIEINREVGGDLAEVLERVSATVRERGYLRRQVKSLSAEGRMSGYVLMALPLMVGMVIRNRNPAYFSELTRGAGLFMIGAAIVLWVVGGLWLRKICRFSA